MIEMAKFCDTCEYRGSTVGGKRCFRTESDLLTRLAFVNPDSMLHVVNETDDQAISEVSPAEAAASFTLDATPDMIACAEIVSAGGEPLW